MNKIKISSEVSNKIVKDWLVQFPSLQRYKSTNKLLKRVRFVVYGIELEKYVSTGYRPRFVMYNLLDVSGNISITCIDKILKNNKGLDVSIKYVQHENTYLDACRMMKLQASIDFAKESSIEEIIEAILTFIEKDILGTPYYSCLAVMQLSRLLDSEAKKESYFNKAVDELNKIPRHILEMKIKDFDSWIENIRNLTPIELEKIELENLKKIKV